MSRFCRAFNFKHFGKKSFKKATILTEIESNYFRHEKTENAEIIDFLSKFLPNSFS